MMIPHFRRTETNTGTDPVAADFSGSESVPKTPNNNDNSNNDDDININVLIIVCTIVGIVVVISSVFLAYYFRARGQRRRQPTLEYESACMRDPNLTWEEYSRRTRLTRSRILLEEELQRDIMIRKSLQSRVNVSSVAVTPVSPPARTRSKAWHGRSGSGASADTDEGAADGAGDGAGEGEGLLSSSLRGDWTEHEARVERTWQILHRKYPSARRATLPAEEDGGGGDDDDGGVPVRPPTIRLKTPPLLSHPMFRGWNGEGGDAKHSSLPTELTKIRPARI